MNFADFDSAITRAKAYKLPCVICKLLNPDTPIKRRNPFFIMKLESFTPRIAEKASVEGCTVPLVDDGIVGWQSPRAIEVYSFRRK